MNPLQPHGGLFGTSKWIAGETTWGKSLFQADRALKTLLRVPRAPHYQAATLPRSGWRTQLTTGARGVRWHRLMPAGLP